MEPKRSFPIPVNYFSISLGLLSLGLAWRSAAAMLNMPLAAGNILLAAGGISWTLFVLIYIYKWIYCIESARLELHNTVQCCFISLIPITTILMGSALLPYGRLLAQVFIFTGILGALLFAAYRSAGLWRGTHVFDATTPVIYLPTVAASFASASALGALGLPEWGLLFIGAGFFSWLSLEPAVLQRLRTGNVLPPALRGVMGIQLAPPFVGCAAYLAVNGGEIDVLVKLLLGYGILTFLFLGRLVFWILEKGFTVSLWAFSFGLGSMVAIGVWLQISDTYLAGLGSVLFWLGTVLIGSMILCTLRMIWQGRFLN
ncbi:MAG: dicarboxylate transporter/tellurite-resistance protein TehA [Megasphaera sp.]|nr:dicarboxylate transporter/tellurite-resistance protein TehA [Megasphaera sp.]MCH4187949.1 dicarboxylate transporter/tellurite-resistance protein TehA [Megasphaera sp.]MCH4217669.1 dicarboxylate transporter/tellurite-resistance protein TehA [Megasphaera sp.]